MALLAIVAINLTLSGQSLTNMKIQPLELPKAAPMVVPFNYTQGLIVVPVEVNGCLAHFLFDTGFSGAAISAAWATKHRLATLERPVHLTTAQGIVEQAGKIATGISLHFASLDVSPGPTLVLDLAFLSREDHLEVDGILGSALFLRHVITIDYRNRRILLGDGPPIKAGDIELPFDRRKLPIVTAQVDTRAGKMHSGRFLVDTGSDDGIELNGWFAEKYKGALLERHRAPSGSGYDLAGPMNYDVGTLRKIRFDGVDFPQLPVSMPASNDGSSGKGLTGIIGNTFLERFAVTIDYSRGQLVLHPPQS